jgi:hypothetical protein
MSEYQKLFTDFQNKVLILQENCPHSEKTEWKWSMGYTYIKYCKRCGKLTDKIKVTTDNEFQKLFSINANQDARKEGEK